MWKLYTWWGRRLWEAQQETREAKVEFVGGGGTGRKQDKMAMFWKRLRNTALTYMLKIKSCREVQNTAMYFGNLEGHLHMKDCAHIQDFAYFRKIWKDLVLSPLVNLETKHKEKNEDLGGVVKFLAEYKRHSLTYIWSLFTIVEKLADSRNLGERMSNY